MTTTSGPELRADERGSVDVRDEVVGSRTVRVRPRPRLGYLPALDGLRAIAVLAVLFFHADLPWAPGGFLGVDVFFVLSGFLITTLLLESAAKHGAPDFRRFYLRRARRLLPALFLVLVGSTLLVVTVATDDAANQQRDLPAALLYVTNWVYIFTDQSYFEATGRPPMLEHLWSLAVEEQFYLIWPWVFLVAWRLGRSARVRRFALIGALASTVLMVVISLINGYPVPNDPSRVYFGTDTHAMGLLIGAALATLWLPARARRAIAPGARATVDGVAALSLILLMVVFWQTQEDSRLLYYGGFLLLSVLVAVLIVAVTHPASRVGVALGSQPWRWIGQRSYGIYLWHWPVFLVTRPGIDIPLTGWANLALRFALTFGLAELSYRFVEDPIRRHGFRESWQALLAWLSRAGRFPAAVGRRPWFIIGVAAALLLVLTVRLYTIPPPVDYLGGITSLTVTIPNSDRWGADRVPEGNAPASPAVKPGYLGLGESVMIGANSSLRDAFGGIAIDADVGRQGDEMVQRVQELSDGRALRRNVVLHFGSNSPISENTVRAILDRLADSDRVVVVNVSVPRRWQDPNNQALAAVVPQYPNAILVDWRGAVAADPNLVVEDGVHLTGGGIRRYVELIQQADPGLTPTG